ncbi:MAG: hypothetical protein EPN22_16925 [Nitrospirae bacterium]|nr:MAG: hypothetical protein EPN22_16925 [Nitrospirota bacterium]
MNILWMAKGKFEGKDVYLTHRVRETKADLLSDIMHKAREEGFKGTIDERLKELDWEIVQVEFHEVKIGQ